MIKQSGALGLTLCLMVSYATPAPQTVLASPINAEAFAVRPCQSWSNAWPTGHKAIMKQEAQAALAKTSKRAAHATGFILLVGIAISAAFGQRPHDNLADRLSPLANRIELADYGITMGDRNQDMPERMRAFRATLKMFKESAQPTLDPWHKDFLVKYYLPSMVELAVDDTTGVVIKGLQEITANPPSPTLTPSFIGTLLIDQYRSTREQLIYAYEIDSSHGIENGNRLLKNIERMMMQGEVRFVSDTDLRALKNDAQEKKLAASRRAQIIEPLEGGALLATLFATVWGSIIGIKKWRRNARLRRMA